MPTIEQLQQQLKDVDATKIFFTDFNGRLMNIPVNPDNIAAFCRGGVGFDGSSVAGYARVDNSDRLLVPDPQSFRRVNFTDQTLGFFIGNVHSEKDVRAQSDPRAVLERVLEGAQAEFGFRFIVGPEHEFFLLTGDEFGPNAHSDKAGYCNTAPGDRGEEVRNRIIAVLRQSGVRFEKTHHEVTPSQHEINLEPTDPLAAADRTVLFNFVTRKVAADSGYRATFMPKPFDGYNRSAFHIHLSMQDRDGRNAFHDPADPEGLSTTARRFIAGIIKYGRETSIVMASTFNSYKAYVVEREAPIIRGWGFRNRSSMVRVPYAGAPESTRIELRSPDPAGNPYLQLATCIAMGLQGLREDLACPRPDQGSTYARQLRTRVWDRRYLPKSIYEALVEAERSRFLRDLLGERVYRNFMDLKIAEWETHRVHVTGLELEQYLAC